MPSLGQLSFIGRLADNRINLWSPAEVASDWDAQCRRGREYGREAVEYVREMNDAAMLPVVLRTIAERSTFGGVEVGFFAAASMSLTETA